ncbi:DUF1203 domain-containing protein [Luteimonas aestuarii]|uniref:DUF1203 domain-containing protein n=1 Tax=Luteimonas aestuarii TaxID=453837 RepID=A0A4R5TM01_9GAMM|nr:DUF1203 domain-containing protein [Luteimonas aestuarii]TDK22741.1 DUF1203 domain-containing protein [Luteimonas aestuarii]
MAFQLSGIDPAPFEALFALDDARLRELGAKRCIADSDRGYPCRVSLEDAKTGDELLLLPYEHQPATSPYRASGPIFVRRGAMRRVLPASVVPPYVSARLMSLRAYDAGHMMIDAEVCEGVDVARELARMFRASAIAYVHLHNARRGCFSCVAHPAWDESFGCTGG